MKFRFHREAETEFAEAANHYENIRPGLGIDFTRQIHVAIQEILRHPAAWSKSIQTSVAVSLTVSHLEWFIPGKVTES